VELDKSGWVSSAAQEVRGDGDSAQGVVVRNTFAVLRVLGRLQRPIGVTRLAAEVGIPKTTVHRLLEQLARENVVERRDRKWSLASGFLDVDRRHTDLVNVAGTRLYAMTRATGAAMCLYTKSGAGLRIVSRTYGPRVTQLMTASDQAAAAEHPASAIWQALQTGQMAAEHRQTHPDCCCIATPFTLASGETAVLGLALPDHQAVESLKRPLDKVASLIVADLDRWEPR
jgi:predicted ArsR family transcriptional regulator